MIHAINGLVLSATIFVVVIAAVSPNVAAVDMSKLERLSTVATQSDIDRQPPRDVDLDSSAPNEMTPEMSREMHDFRQLMQSLSVVVVIIVIGLIGVLLILKKIGKRKKSTQKRR